jgi:hypothetical protein
MKIHKKYPRLSISFSGGKTSAYMAQLLVKEYRHLWEEIVVVFANTGQEHEKTLQYVEKCDKEYGLNVVWLEAVVDPVSGKGTKHRVVNFDTASCKGEPYEEVIQKFGIPNQTFQSCNRELKLRPMTSYLRSIGWFPNTYNVAIGIRADEIDRISPITMEQGGFYPLINLGIKKSDVLAWELQQKVRLGIPEHWGNCTWCWKKSYRKLATVAREMPGVFEFPKKMETKYPNSGAGNGNRKFFRGNKTVADIFEMAKDPELKPFIDGFPFSDSDMDQGSACGENCEIGTDGAHDDGLIDGADLI